MKRLAHHCPLLIKPHMMPAVAAARDQLGEKAFTAAWQEGSQLLAD